MPPELTRKWRELAEQRCAHFLELYKSGRWKHYYTEEELLARTSEALRLSEAWGALAEPPDEAPTLATA